MSKGAQGAVPGKAKAHLSALGVLSWGPSNRPCDFLPREIATYNYRNECQQMAQLRAGVRLLDGFFLSKVGIDLSSFSVRVNVIITINDQYSTGRILHI